jgi:tetratricopeptide (TPR) repeat protein
VDGTSGAGGSTSDEATRWLTAYRYGTTLFDYGLDQITDGDWEQARAFFERALAYRSLRNAAYNIGIVHLAYGRRDLAVYFFRLYVNATREAREDAGVQAALRAIEDSPPRVGNQSRRNELSDQLAAAINRALGETPGGTETPSSAGTPPPGT